MEVPTQCEVFVHDLQAMPSLGELVAATDPDQAEELYSKAGLVRLADNAGPIRRATVAAQCYAALPRDDFELYARHLAREIKLEDCTTPPPDTALSVLVTAQEAKLFDDIVILRDAASTEWLLLGIVTVGGRVQRFKIAHWGSSLTDVAKLRKRQRRRSVGQRIRRFFQDQCLARMRRWARGRYAWLYFGTLTALAALVCWLFLLPLGWWLLAGGLVAAMGACAWYALRSSDTLGGVVAAGALAATNVVAVFIVGLVILDTAMSGTHTEEVLVCSVTPPTTSDDAWTAETTEGSRVLREGFYNGTYYKEGSEKAARSLVGHWVRLTEQGSSSTVSTTVTGADTLRPGSCG